MMNLETYKPTAEQVDKINPNLNLARGVNTFPNEIPPERVILGNGFLRRGDALTLVSTAGAGKSVAMVQAAICWGLGLPYLNIAPSKPLRVLLFSGEDDDVTLGQCRDGLIANAPQVVGREITQGEIEGLKVNMRTDFNREHTGNDFHLRLDAILTAEPADLVLVNPLFSYVGGDIVKDGGPWFRAGLLPLLQKHDCAAVVACHTNRMAKDGWENTDDVYSAIGGSEMGNIPRAVLTLRPTKNEGLFMLRAGKRQTTGWQDSNGDFTASLYLRKSGDPILPAWLPVPHDEAEEMLETAAASKGRKPKATTQDVIDLLQAGARNRQGLIGGLKNATGCGLTAAKDVIREAEPSLHRWTQKNPAGGKDVVWFCLPEHAENYNGRK